MQNSEIVNCLKQIEKEQNVRILFAAESGSRAWGFASPDSDWDVRFIYVRPLDSYLSIAPIRDVIEVATEDGFDAAGWDIRKALQLFQKSNVTIFEWMKSPIVYIENSSFCEQLNGFLPKFFNPKRAAYHYIHNAENHQNHYLEKRGVELKRYLYFLRGVLACKWIFEKNTLPPVPFRELVKATVSDKNSIAEINEILEIKAASREHDKEPISETLLQFGKDLRQQMLEALPTAIEVHFSAESSAELCHFLCKIIKNE